MQSIPDKKHLPSTLRDFFFFSSNSSVSRFTYFLPARGGTLFGSAISGSRSSVFIRLGPRSGLAKVKRPETFRLASLHTAPTLALSLRGCYCEHLREKEIVDCSTKAAFGDKILSRQILLSSLPHLQSRRKARDVCRGCSSHFASPVREPGG